MHSIIYKKKKVSIGTGEGGDEYRICLQKSGVSLPKGYYFGMSVSKLYKLIMYIHDPVTYI
jgi:hypothetical protein